MNKRKTTFTSWDIANILEVYPSTITRWISNNELKAFKTPGGHYRVELKDLKDFADRHGITLEDKLKNNTILIVEDEPTLQKTIKKALKKGLPDYRVACTSDGFEAGKKFSELNPSLVILDLMLPGIDGFRVCSNIRKTDSSVKILIISGYPSEENIKKIMNKGADKFLAKPFSIEELLTEVNKLLENERKI